MINNNYEMMKFNTNVTDAIKEGLSARKAEKDKSKDEPKGEVEEVEVQQEAEETKDAE